MNERQIIPIKVSFNFCEAKWVLQRPANQAGQFSLAN